MGDENDLEAMEVFQPNLKRSPTKGGYHDHKTYVY